MKYYQRAIQCRDEFNKAWVGEVPEEITQLFAAIVEKAEKENVFDINMTTNYGSSLLHLIVVTCQDQTKAADILLANGADIDLAEADNRTPLHLAIDKFSKNNNKYNFVNFLIKNGADINKGDKTGKTSLHHVVMLMDYSLSNHSRSLFLPLLVNGAAVTKQDNDGISAYKLFQDKIDSEAYGELEKLVICVDECYKKEKKLALQSAINFKKEFEKKWKSAKKPYGYLLDNLVPEVEKEGIFNVDFCTRSGISLLHYAAACQEIEILQLLLENGSNVNIQTRQDNNYWGYGRKGYTALHCVLNSDSKKKFGDCEWKSIDDKSRLCILLLMKHGAKLDIPDQEGFTVLNSAIGNWQHDNGFLYDLLIPNPYERSKLTALQFRTYQPPSLLEICFFATRKALSKDEIESKKNMMPSDVYSHLVS
jgi:ankyrin repeat protein